MKNKKIYEYIASLNGNQYKTLRRQLTSTPSQYLNDLKTMKKKDMLNMVEVGGNFGTFVKKSINLSNPINSTKRDELKKNKKINKEKQKNKNTLTDEVKQYAKLLKETYKPENERQDIGDYKLDKIYSTDEYSIYSKNNKDGQKEHYYIYRGTKDEKDLIPDLRILTGTMDFSKDQKQFNKIRKQINEENKSQDENNWKIIGHSLGGTKAMWIGQRENLDVHSFNPGYSYLFEEKLDTKHPKLNLYLAENDPISHGITFEELNDKANIYNSNKNALESHSINFFDQDN